MASGPSTPFPSSGRPELEEFLTALNGFLNHESSVSDSAGYFKFLGIFCRSIGASEGHMLTPEGEGRLKSALSFGLKKDFEGEYNRNKKSHPQTDTPMETAFKQQDVVAVVDVAKDPDIPSWYGQLLKKNEFRSLVAVPLISPSGPKGILCAYYHDVCLFDQGTLNHLAMIGKMVGAATDKEGRAGPSGADAALEGVDKFLTGLSQAAPGSDVLFKNLASSAAVACRAGGAFCGPVHKTSHGLSLTLSGTHGFGKNPGVKDFVLPPQLQKSLMTGRDVDKTHAINLDDWGILGDSMNPPGSHAAIFPISLKDKVFGALLIWRVGEGFTPVQIQSGLRLSLLAAVILSGPPDL